MESLKISTEFIKLDQFLKWAGICDIGSEAKEMISQGKVKVNGSIELQRGKKLRKADVIEVKGKTYRIEQ